MSESITSTMDTSEIPVVAVETGEESEQLDMAVASPQQSTVGRIGGASRELKAILALSKESNFEVNLSKKRKSDHRRHTNEPKSSSSKRDHRPTKFPVTAESELEMSRKDPRPVRFPVTAESELDLEVPQFSEAKGSDESPAKLSKKKKSLMGLVESQPNVSGPSEEKKRERKHGAGTSLGDIPIFKPNKDMFCWRCHKEGVNIACETCPRSYHQKCLRQAIDDAEHWPCPECVGILRAESTKSRSPAMKGMTLEHLCSLLKFAVQRMKQVAGSQPFAQAVDTKDVPEYEKYIVQPMDLSALEKNIKENLYGSTHAFEADAKWILHNSIVFNSYQSKLTSSARTIMKICKQEMAEIENCPTCYLNANTKKKTWFVEVCPKPHLLVWAKLKGFPFWPGKVMKCRDGNVDVRFFGAHDRAWVPEKECFLYIPRDPNNFRSKRNDLEKCIAELKVHVENLKQVFGQFCYPDARIPIDPHDELKQLQIFLPQYKSYINRTKRHKLFHTTDHIGGSVKDKEGTSKERSNTTDVEETNEEEVKTELPIIEVEEPTCKDDLEQMEGYGTDDESMPLIDLKTRKKLLNKSISDESIVNAETDDKDMDRKGPLKGFASIRDPIILEMNTELLRKQFLEKNVDSSMFSDSKSDSSRHSEKISTVDVLEDMEINLGNDQGMPCVNISRKNSFDSSDHSKSDTESNTSSRKGPVKMDVENFEVILTSPTKMKIVDKLMKKLSDDNSSDDGQAGSTKHKVLKRLTDTESSSCVEEDRGETSPEPKQLEEPPMDYSDQETETNDISEKTEETLKSDSFDASSRVDNDKESEKLLEEPISDSTVDPIKSTETIETFEKTKENKSEKVVKSNIFVVTKEKSADQKDGTVEKLKIKIKIPKSKPEIVEDKDQKHEKENPQKNLPARKRLLSPCPDKVNDKKICLETEVPADQSVTAQFENAESTLVEKSDDKKLLDEVVSTKPVEKVPLLGNKKDDLKGQTKKITVSKKNKLSENNANTDDKKKETCKKDETTVKELAKPCSEPVLLNKSQKETLKLAIEEPEEITASEKKESFKSDTEDSEKAIETGTMIILENGEKAIVSESPTCSETDQLEDEADDNIPLAHIAERSDAKVMQGAPKSKPNEETEKNSKQKEMDQVSITSESSPNKISKSSELELSPAVKNDENTKTLNEKPKVTPNKNLTDVLKEVSTSKNIEIVSEAESSVSTASEISLPSLTAQSPDNISKLLSNEVMRKTSSGESSGDESNPPSLKEIQQKLSASKKRKRKLSAEKAEDNEKKAKAEGNKEVADKDNEKMDMDKETNADKKQTSPENKNGQKEGEKESIFPKISLKNLAIPDKSAKQCSAITTAEQLISSQSVSEPTVLDLDDIKSEVESDQEAEPFIENQGLYPNRNQNGVLEKEAKRKYLSALNILDRDSEALHKKKDTGEIRTRSKTEKKKQDALMEEKISKTIDDVAVNFSAKKLASSGPPVLSKVQRRSQDAQQQVKSVVESAPNLNRSENGEIFVKSFAKIVPTLKPRARKSFPQTQGTSTEAKQIQQIKLARREEAAATKSARKDKDALDAKSSSSSSTPIAGMPKILNKDIANTINGNALTEITTNTSMTTLQQLENMTTNKSYVIVSPQNPDMVMLPPNKPIIYQTPAPPRISAAPITTTTQTPPSMLPFATSPSSWKPVVSEKPSVNLTDSQNYIPFNKDQSNSQDTTTITKKSPFSKQLSLLVSNTISMATQAAQSNATAALTPVVNVTSLTTAQPQQQTAVAGASMEDEEMPLQSESVSSNGPRDFLVDSVTGNVGTDVQQDLNNGPTQSETPNNEQSNPEEEEFRLIDSLIPGSVAKVVHEIVKRPPPRLKPRPPGMLSTVFREGVPSFAGPVTSKINSVAHRLSDYFRGMLVETLEDLGKSGSREATIASLKVEIEALKHKHSIELSEIEKNMCTVLKDIQRSIVEDRERLIDETRRDCETETIKRIEEAKSKQWCAMCLKEAQFYCCWNTSYCDYPCQQKHWPQHMTKCTQNTTNGGINAAQSSAVTTVPTVVRPLVGQQLILRPTGAKPGTLGKIFTKPIQKVYLNRNPKTLRVQSSTGGYLTVMESQPGQYQVVNAIPRFTEVRTYNSNTLTTHAKKPATVTTSATGTKPAAGQKGTAAAKVMSHSVLPGAHMFDDDSD